MQPVSSTAGQKTLLPLQLGATHEPEALSHILPSAAQSAQLGPHFLFVSATHCGPEPPAHFANPLAHVVNVHFVVAPLVVHTASVAFGNCDMHV